MLQYDFPRFAIFVGLLMHTGCSPNTTNFDALTIPPEAQPKGEAFRQGREILNESQRAYENIESYGGTIEVMAASGYQGRQSVGEPRTFEILFRSPKNLRLEGPDSNGDPIVIVIDGESNSVESADWGRPGQRKERFESAEEALYAYSGVTLGGSEFLPGCLLDIAWKNEDPGFPKDKSFLRAWATKAKLDGTSQVENHECHRILCERDTVTCTIYVDTKTNLIRRVDTEVSEAQMRRLRRLGWGGGASGRVISSSRSQILGIDEVQWKNTAAGEHEKQP